MHECIPVLSYLDLLDTVNRVIERFLNIVSYISLFQRGCIHQDMSIRGKKISKPI